MTNFVSEKVLFLPTNEPSDNKLSQNTKNSNENLCSNEKNVKLCIKKYQDSSFRIPKKLFTCDICDYNTSYKSNLEKHFTSFKHYKTTVSIGKTTVKNAYDCAKCGYTTNIKSNYVKHCSTQKHAKKHSSFENEYICEHCDKSYKSMNYLNRHKQYCKKSNFSSGSETLNNDDLKTMFMTIMEENKELQNKLIELAKEPKIVNNNITNNKQFNIITFLNDDCKDAFNLTEFIQNFKITFEDLHHIEKYGYIQGVKDSLIRSLSQMEQTKRPIHCTDPKRKHFYIKENNEWDKDSRHCKINSAINMYNNVQLKTLLEWKKDPSLNKDEKYQDRLNQIICEVSSMYQEEGDKIRNKIVNEIGNVTTIEK